jgi:hypothetical protein
MQPRRGGARVPSADAVDQLHAVTSELNDAIVTREPIRRLSASSFDRLVDPANRVFLRLAM